MMLRSSGPELGRGIRNGEVEQAGVMFAVGCGFRPRVLGTRLTGGNRIVHFLKVDRDPVRLRTLYPIGPGRMARASSWHWHQNGFIGNHVTICLDKWLPEGQIVPEPRMTAEWKPMGVQLVKKSWLHLETE